MLYAFDYGGCLQFSETLREIARALVKQGHKVMVISAIGSGEDHEPGHHKWVRKHCATMGIDWFDLQFVMMDTPDCLPYLPMTPDGRAEYYFGQKKVAVMKQFGAAVLIDDNPHIIRAVRDAGLGALLWHLPPIERQS